MKQFGLGMLSLLIALLALELFSRAIATFIHDSELDRKNQNAWFVYSPELGWERKPGYEGIVATTERKFDEQGYSEGDQQKLSDSTHKKILFIGDSNTFGFAQPAEKTFTSVVDSLLADAVTINLAVPGYSSYQGKLVLRYALTRFHP